MSTTIYRYQPAITPGPSGTDPRPVGPDDASSTLTELCEVDGWRYVSVPDTITPSIPDAITTWEPAVLTDELVQRIKQESPHCRLIAERTIEKIRATYTIDDELYLARISVGALRGTYPPSPDELARIDAYQIDVETFREEARAARAELGL